jgi:hypothetical protein
VLAGLLLALAPLGLLAAGAAAADGRALAAGQLASRHQVTAHPFVDAVAPSGDASGPDGSLQPQQVLVAWTDTDGTARKAIVPVAAGKTARSPIRLWVDQDGRPTSAPFSAADIRTRAVTIGMTTGLGAGLIALLGYLLLVHWVLDARRIRRWEEEWAVVEPRWTRRVP